MISILRIPSLIVPLWQVSISTLMLPMSNYIHLPHLLRLIQDGQLAAIEHKLTSFRY